MKLQTTLLSVVAALLTGGAALALSIDDIRPGTPFYWGENGGSETRTHHEQAPAIIVELVGRTVKWRDTANGNIIESPIKVKDGKIFIRGTPISL